MSHASNASIKNDHPQDNFKSEMHPKPTMYPFEAVCEDWQLSDRLCATLANIFLSREYQSCHQKAKVLDAALACLRDEVHSLTLKPE